MIEGNWLAPNAQVFAVNGGAGAGKTTWLLDRLEEELKQIPANRIAFMSFTRKGAYAGVDRAKEKFNINPEDCRWFCTIHSACSKVITDTSGLMHQQDYDRVAESFHWSKMKAQWYREAVSRLRRNGVKREEAKGNSPRVTQELQEYWGVLDVYKEQMNKKDFDDLITSDIKSLDIDVAFIDEAQDLTGAQWSCVAGLIRNVQRVYIAGDINQSVMRFAGASPEVLHHLYQQSWVKVTYLDVSYRCPSAICLQAANVLESDTRLAFVPPVKTNRYGGFVIELERNNLLTLMGKILVMYEQCKMGKTLYAVAHSTERARTLGDVLTLCGIPHIQDFRGDKLTPAFPAELMKLARIVSDLMDGKLEVTVPNRYAQTFYELVPCTRTHEKGSSPVKLRLKKPLTDYPLHVKRELIAWWQATVYASGLDELRMAGLISAVITRNCRVPAEFVLCATVQRVKGGEADYVVYDATCTQNIESDWGYHGYTALTRAKQGALVFCASNSRRAKTTPHTIYNNIKETGWLSNSEVLHPITEELQYDNEHIWRKLESSVFDISNRNYAIKLHRKRYTTRANSRTSRCGNDD